MPAHPCLKKGAAAARRATHADDLEGRLAVNRLHKVLPVKAWASRLRTARVTYHITAALSTVIVAAVPATGPRGLRADLLHQVRDCGQGLLHHPDGPGLKAARARLRPPPPQARH